MGAGITGALIADRLVAAGADVVLVDKRAVGLGSTAASTALIEYELDLPLCDLRTRIGTRDADRAYRLCVDAIDELAALVDRLDDRCDFARRPSLYLAAERGDAKMLESERAARAGLGIEVEYLDRHDLRARYGLRRSAALLSAAGAQLDPYRLTRALVARALAGGARLFEATPVTGFAATKAGVELRAGPSGRVRARRAVFAVGYEARELLRDQVADLKSTYALVSEPLARWNGWRDGCLIWEHADPYLFIRTTADGRAIVGGEDVDFVDDERRDRLIDRKRRRLEAKFHRLFPEIELRSAAAWAGTFGETKDALPYLGVAPGFPKASFALCYGGNGITFGAIAARLVTAAVLDRPAPDIELFRFGR